MPCALDYNQCQTHTNTHKHTIFFLDVKSLLCFQHVLCLVKQRRQGSGWRAPAHAQYSLILPVYLQMIADVPFARLSATDCRRYSKICGCLRALCCFSRHHLDEIRWYHSECTHQRGAHETASQLVFPWHRRHHHPHPPHHPWTAHRAKQLASLLSRTHMSGIVRPWENTQEEQNKVLTRIVRTHQDRNMKLEYELFCRNWSARSRMTRTGP